ncbi:MAG TPA: S26 family signal peptidase, partial [Bryobacteraceae bacterium]|nr:S26 family signal peptidase [Bryobacteraceae bacterium]
MDENQELIASPPGANGSPEASPTSAAWENGPESPGADTPSPPMRRIYVNRGVIAEWTVTIILLLFGTTTLVQAFVIPTGSMEDTLLIGDHLLVDKLSYAPSGPASKHILPYTEVKRGDIIVFR